MRGALRVAVCCFVLLNLSLQSQPSAGRTPLQSVAQTLVGREFDYAVRPGDTFRSISSRLGVSVAVIASLNQIQRNAPLRPRQLLRIDNRHIVPKVLDDGILINIPQRMLFVFESGRVTRDPVSVGRPTWPTPVGQFTVLQKRENPVWIVPYSIHAR